MAGVCLGLCLVSTGLTHAQGRNARYFAPESRPTRGLYRPGPLVGLVDATSMELNPGQFGLLEGAELAFLHNEIPNETTLPGRGSGIFLGLPLSKLKLGGSLQWINPAGPLPSQAKSQVALGLGDDLGGRVGVGLVWNHLFANQGSGFEGLDTLDLGVSLRPWRFLGLGIALRDINQPRTETPRRIQSYVEAEVAWRPFGRDTLELAGGFHAGTDRPAWGYRGRASGLLYPGLRALAQVERITLDDVQQAGFSTREWRATLALSVSFGTSQIASALITNSNRVGSQFLARIHGRRWEELWPDKRYESIRLQQFSQDHNFAQLLVHLHELGQQRGVKGVLLHLDGFALGLAQSEELRKLLLELRQKGLEIHAYFRSLSMRGYYLAAACTRIHMQRTGTLSVSNLARSTFFFKEGLDRLGVRVDVARVGAHKGAMEPFMRADGYSDPVAENWTGITQQAADRIISSILKDRNLQGHQTQLKQTIDQGILTAPQAIAAGLVDASADTLDLGTIDGFNVIPYQPRAAVRRAWASPRVAVVMVSGPIVLGPSRSMPLSSGLNAGSQSVVADLRRAQQDDLVRAVVLRVDSPGGSLQASQEIASAINSLQATGKPVIVSMGNAAASGGYYISAPADHIFASPSTLTGSIGIYTYHVSFAGLLSRLGIRVASQATSKTNPTGRVDAAWNETERSQMQSHIEALYEMFLEVVREGRGQAGTRFSRDELDALGQGLILSGADAHEVALVDQQGGLLQAVAEAARHGGIDLPAGDLPEIQIYPAVEASLISRLLQPDSIDLNGSETRAPWGTAGTPPSTPSLLPVAQMAAAQLLGPLGRASLRWLAPLAWSTGDERAWALAPLILDWR